MVSTGPQPEPPVESDSPRLRGLGDITVQRCTSKNVFLDRELGGSCVTTYDPVLAPRGVTPATLS